MLRCAPSGTGFHFLAVIDDCTRESLALIADTSISGRRVARELDGAIRLYGRPATIVSDNGTELTSRAILEWQNEKARDNRPRAAIREHLLRAVLHINDGVLPWSVDAYIANVCRAKRDSTR